MEHHTAELLTAVRSAIASACLDALPPAELGEVTLRDDQRLLVARAERAMRQYGGCLVADDVGRGKTYVALALVRRIGIPLVVVPAPLVHAWSAAMARCSIDGDVVTHTALSRGIPDARAFDVIIVDESHHFRNPGIRRYDTLAQLAARAPLVLLSATPLQNRVRDLAAQIALFLGAAAFELSLEDLMKFLVRSDDASIGLPATEEPRWIPLGVDDAELLDALLQLPEPVRPRDGGDEGALRRINLLRAWASSRAALQSAIRRRRQLAVALEQGLTEGLLPSRQEARSWLAVDDAVQLGLTSLLVGGDPLTDASRLSGQLNAECSALARIASLITRSPDPDDARTDALIQIRQQHPNERILVFSEFASTVRAFFARLKSHSGVGMLCSSEARIASGTLSRGEILRSFAPHAQGGNASRSHEQVTLLLTTDLLAEGLDLQDASVVVHLDLPWNPARLTQRLGRVRRPGGAIKVHSYFLSPPASVKSLLRAEERLSNKAQVATAVTGATNEALPVLTSNGLNALIAGATAPGATASTWGTIMRVLASWRAVLPERETPLCMKVGARQQGWVACLSDGTLAAGGISVSSAIDLLERAHHCVRLEPGGPEMQPVNEWWKSVRQESLAGLNTPMGAYRMSALAQLARLSRHLPRSEQASAMGTISNLRGMLGRPMPLALERSIHEALNLHLRGAFDSIPHLEHVLKGRDISREDTSTLVAAAVFAPLQRDFAT